MFSDPPSSAVAAVFESHPPATRQRLMELRRLIIETAAATAGVGRIEEALKWGQISYLTPETKSGTTIRIDARGSGVAMFVNCKTDLVARYRETYPESFAYEGDRALLIEDGQADRRRRPSALHRDGTDLPPAQAQMKKAARTRPSYNPWVKRGPALRA